MRHFTVEQGNLRARETRNLTVSRETKWSCPEFSCVVFMAPLTLNYIIYIINYVNFSENSGFLQVYQRSAIYLLHIVIAQYVGMLPWLPRASKQTRTRAAKQLHALRSSHGSKVPKLTKIISAHL